MPVVSRGVIYPNEIDRILKMPGGPPGVAIRRISLNIAAEAEKIAKQELGNRHPADAKRSGRYAKAFRVDVTRNVTTGYEFEVSNKTPYAATLEFGSVPHEIRAKKAKFLRFRSRKDGQWRRVKVVQHPGQTKGYFILTRAMQRVVRASFGYSPSS